MTLHGATIVAAHPDDEVLWMSSILVAAERALVCFGPSDNTSLTEGRAQAVRNYPLGNVEFLNQHESGAFRVANWEYPVATEVGLEFYRHPGTWRRYRRNHAELSSKLEPFLAEASTVVCHNPWGEYGNEEHVQVFRIVDALRRKHGFQLWVPGVFGRRSARLMQLESYRLSETSVRLRADDKLGQDLKRMYMDQGVWTWNNDYRWPQDDIFIRIAEDGERPRNFRVTDLQFVDSGAAPPTFKGTWKRRVRGFLG